MENSSTAGSIEGEMFGFCKKDKNLVAFVSTCKEPYKRICTNAVILLPGLGDGFMSLSYTWFLKLELQKIDFSLVQVNLSSSFNQFGFSSLKQDSKEIGKLIDALKTRYNFQRIVMIGHSTGNQDVLYFLRHGDPHLTQHVSAIILQAAVSDRDVMVTFKETPRMTNESSELVREGKGDHFLSDRLYDAPITADRYSSLIGRLTPDDMFSVDLREEELKGVLGAVKVPVLMCFSEEDEYVPNRAEQRAMTDRMVSVLTGQGVIVKCVFMPGDHGLTSKHYYQPFVEQVCGFIQANK